MNILFYLEPHPVRSPLEFYWVGEKIIKMLSDEFYWKKFISSNIHMRILCSRAIHEKLARELPGLSGDKFILKLSKDESDHIESNFYLQWNMASIRKWTELMKGEGEITNFYLDILTRVHQKYNFELIVYWGTNGAVRRFSKIYNIPAIALELGCTRSPFFESICVDFCGVNGSSYTNFFDLEKYEPEYTLEEIQSIFPMNFKEGKTHDAAFDVLPLGVNSECYESPGKNVFIPLQLSDDANIILYSNYISMLEYLESIIPGLVAAGYRCFVKPHPGAHLRKVNSSDHEACKKYCEKIDSVFWLDNVDNQSELLSIYEKMDVFLVINSSIGFEAMVLGKTVICMGVSPYNLSKDIPTYKQLISGNLDKEKCTKINQKIVNLLLFYYLHEYSLIFNFPTFIQALLYSLEVKNTLDRNGGILLASSISKTNTLVKLDAYPMNVFLDENNPILQNNKPTEFTEQKVEKSNRSLIFNANKASWQRLIKNFERRNMS